jgi:hypothetical protein
VDTFEEQLTFFKEQWPLMKEAAESGGSKAVIQFVDGFDDDTERRVLYAFARQGLSMDEWSGKSFDVLIDVGRAGISELLTQAEMSDDAKTRDRRTDTANVIAYNLAADLADCWPGDDAPRTKAHFKAGLEAAERCIRWRKELKKGAWPHSMAYWAKGYHQLALGDTAGAVESLQTSLDFARKGAEEDGKPPTVTADGDFAVIVGAGYLGLVRWVQGDEEGRDQYEEAIEAFRAQLDDESRKDDAEFGIAQLEKVKDKFVSA